jgi:hypothetical protein
MYDETKLEAAVDAWVEKRAKLGFGQHYIRDLLADFESFLAETAMLQASSGVVAFGRQLIRLGLGTRRLHGVTYRTGIALQMEIQQTKRARYAPTLRKQKTAEATKAKVATAARKKAVMSDEERAERKRKVKERMAQEDADKHRNVQQENEV